MIGALRTSGTAKDDLVLIGAEMVTGNAATDISDFSPQWQKGLGRYFQSDPFRNIIPLNVHEYVHTQQTGFGNSLLGRSLFEGTCDFVTELVTGKAMPLSYMAYGPMHEAELKEKFQIEMFNPFLDNWFYNQTNEHPDLGYYMGYAICRSYYQQATNKKQAIKEMIELDYNNDRAVVAFTNKARFFSESVEQLYDQHERRRPIVTAVHPINGQDSLVDASVKEIQIEFSTVMAHNTGTDYGSGGKEQFPVVGQPGFSADKRSYTYLVDLQPGRTYSFKVTGGGFRSKEGYLLKDYEVKFRTKE